jgi:hypothetical protein
MNGETVTKIVDRCRHPVTMAGEDCRASSGFILGQDAQLRPLIIGQTHARFLRQ